MAKSQLQKFYERQAKANAKKASDEVAVNTRAYQKLHEEEIKYGAEGVEELMAQGNIKEAAVVFSQEGMKAFANMFGNSMENAVTNVLNNRIDDITRGIQGKVEAIIESKMLEMLEGMTEGMKRLAQVQQPEPPKVDSKAIQKTVEEGLQRMNKIIFNDDTELTFGEPEEEPRDESKEEPDVYSGIQYLDERDSYQEPIEKPKDDRHAHTRAYTKLMEPGHAGLHPLPQETRLGLSGKDVSFIKNYIMAIMKLHTGEIVNSSDVSRTLKNDFNINCTNLTGAWKRIMKEEPSIENVGFGLYKYEEKNFKPTV